MMLLHVVWNYGRRLRKNRWGRRWLLSFLPLLSRVR